MGALQKTMSAALEAKATGSARPSRRWGDEHPDLRRREELGEDSRSWRRCSRGCRRRSRSCSRRRTLSAAAADAERISRGPPAGGSAVRSSAVLARSPGRPGERPSPAAVPTANGLQALRSAGPVLRHAVHVHHPVLRHGRTRAPGVRMPTRFKGSHALSDTRSSPAFGIFRTARIASTASGRANCSPEKACANRPPRISPAPPAGDRTCSSSSRADSAARAPAGRGRRSRIGAGTDAPASQPLRFPLLRLVRPQAATSARGGVGLSLEEPARAANPSQVSRPAGHSSQSAPFRSRPESPVCARSSCGKRRRAARATPGAARPVTQRFARAAGRVEQPRQILAAHSAMGVARPGGGPARRLIRNR